MKHKGETIHSCLFCWPAVLLLLLVVTWLDSQSGLATYTPHTTCVYVWSCVGWERLSFCQTCNLHCCNWWQAVWNEHLASRTVCSTGWCRPSAVVTCPQWLLQCQQYRTVCWQHLTCMHGGKEMCLTTAAFGGHRSINENTAGQQYSVQELADAQGHRQPPPRKMSLQNVTHFEHPVLAAEHTAMVMKVLRKETTSS